MKRNADRHLKSASTEVCKRQTMRGSVEVGQPCTRVAEADAVIQSHEPIGRRAIAAVPHVDLQLSAASTSLRIRLEIVCSVLNRKCGWSCRCSAYSCASARRVWSRSALSARSSASYQYAMACPRLTRQKVRRQHPVELHEIVPLEVTRPVHGCHSASAEGKEERARHQHGRRVNHGEGEGRREVNAERCGPSRVTQAVPPRDRDNRGREQRRHVPVHGVQHHQLGHQLRREGPRLVAAQGLQTPRLDRGRQGQHRRDREEQAGAKRTLRH